MKVWPQGESPNAPTASNWLQDKTSGSTNRAELRAADGLVCCSADVLVRHVFWTTETLVDTNSEVVVAVRRISLTGDCHNSRTKRLLLTETHDDSSFVLEHRLNTSGSVWKELLLDWFLEILFLMSHFSRTKVTTQNTKGIFLLQYHNQPLGCTRLPPVTAIVKKKQNNKTQRHQEVQEDIRPSTGCDL